ncbi:hypothetical protein BH11PAT2_BH11PAT2_06740 [soil metagenome]
MTTEILHPETEPTLTDVANTVTRLDASVSRLEVTVTDVANTVTRLDVSVSRLEVTVTDLTTTVTNLSTTVSDLSVTVSDVLEVMQISFGRLEDKFESLEDRMEGGFHEMNRRLGSLETNVEDLREEMQLVSRAVDQDSETIIDHENRIVRLEFA